MRLTTYLFDHVKLAVVGGGCSGMAVASKFSKILGSGNVAIVEPQHDHYYQPGFTLVGSGIMNLNQVKKNESDLIPKNVKWINNKVDEFKPKDNKIILDNGKEMNYDYLVIATGVELRFDMIKGLSESLDKPGVCTIYSPKYVTKTYEEIQNLKNGKAVFTFPSTPIKCPGAPQKICYLAEDYWRKNGVRDGIEVIYNTTLPKIFAVDKYANALMKEVINPRGIKLNVRSNLVSIDYDKKIATFELMDENKTFEEKFDFLHVGPPCSPIKPLRDLAQRGDKLVDTIGWINVNQQTLQSVEYKNVFSIGDCVNTPQPKTAASISSQFRVLKTNLNNVINGKEPTAEFDGYASCPLIVSYNKAILAEFTPKGPLETFPINQAKPLWIFFMLKKIFMPFLYWQFLIKGYWNGPKTVRKLLHLGFK